MLSLRSLFAAMDMQEEIVKAMLDILFHSKFSTKDETEIKDIDRYRIESRV